MFRRVSRIATLGSTDQACCPSAVAALRHRTPLGGFDTEYLNTFYRAKKTRESGESNDQLAESRRKKNREPMLLSQVPVPKALRPKGVPTAAAAAKAKSAVKLKKEETPGTSKVVTRSKMVQPRTSKNVSSASSCPAGDIAEKSAQRSPQEHLLGSTTTGSGTSALSTSSVDFDDKSLHHTSGGENGGDLVPRRTETLGDIMSRAALPRTHDGGLSPEAHLTERQQQLELLENTLLTLDDTKDSERLNPEPFEMDCLFNAPKSTVLAGDLDVIEAECRGILLARRAASHHKLLDDVFEAPDPAVDAVQGKNTPRGSGPPKKSDAKHGGVNWIRFDNLYRSKDDQAIMDEVASLDGATAELAASLNPHFPVAEPLPARPTDSDGLIAASASTTGETEAPAVVGAEFSAVSPRPYAREVIKQRPSDFWLDETTGKSLRESANSHEAVNHQDRMHEGPVDCIVPDFQATVMRNHYLKYFQVHPINEMIQEPLAVVQSICPRDGSEEIAMPNSVPIPMCDARKMSKEHGLDLIRLATRFSTKSHMRVVAVCMLGDYREHMRHIVQSRMAMSGVNGAPVKPLMDMSFRGGIHPHGIQTKCMMMSKQLVRGCPIRITLKDFGSPVEGFPVFQNILDELKQQCAKLKAFHRAGPITAEYDEISCFLYPSTSRSPKATITYPSEAELSEVKARRIVEEQKEIYFDDYYDKLRAVERAEYLHKIRKGTAWTDKDDGLTVQKNRRLKIMRGDLPKGNKKLYGARGDVNVAFPFRASHLTSTEKWGYPKESNLDQASRGADILGTRGAMSISEMHDRGETEDNPSVLDRFYYRVNGPALDVGAMKERLGLKTNRKKVPSAGGGDWGTLGINSAREDPHVATK